MKTKRFWQKVISLALAAVIMTTSLFVDVYAATDKLAAPTKVTAQSITYNSMTLKWNKVEGADAYRVYLWNYDTEKYESVAYVKGTSAKIKDLDANTICKFKVRTYDEVNGKLTAQSTSKTFKFKTEKTKLPGPKNLYPYKITIDGFDMKWDPVGGADAYLMFYREKGAKTWNYIKGSNGERFYTTKPRVVVSGLKSNTIYELCVKSYIIENDKYIAQGTSDIYTLQTRERWDILSPHPNIKTNSRSNRIDFTWDGTNAVWALGPYSLIEQWNAKSGEWEFICDAKGNKQVFVGTRVTLNGLKPNKTYKYRIYTLTDDYNYAIQSCSHVITVKTPKRTENEWNGKVDTSWYTGDKESYDISTPEQLAGLAELVNKGNPFFNTTINLTEDIKLNDDSDYENWINYAPANIWTPIGGGGGPVSGYKAFAGLFNGNGHTISGMYVTTENNAGLFGSVIDAAVVNVKVKNSVIHRADSCLNPIGGIVGMSQNSIIDSCEVDGLIISGWNWPTYNDNVAMGGILGRAGQIDQSVLAFTMLSALAGIVWNPIIYEGMGDTYTGGTYINNCISNNVTLHAPDAKAGGVIGKGDEVYIYNCISTNCTIESGHSNGAIAGIGLGKMENCYYYNYNSIGRNTVQYDKDAATALTEKELTSKSLVNKLGSAFEYSKGNAPKLKAARSTQ